MPVLCQVSRGGEYATQVEGWKVRVSRPLPDCEPDSPAANGLGEAAGCSLHAGVATKANERDKLERLCRYITRPAVSTQRLSLTNHGQLRYALKTPWRNGTTHVIFEPLDFISRLAALVPCCEAVSSQMIRSRSDTD